MTNELTLENIRSGAFPSDAHAVGFLLGELEKLRTQIEILQRANRFLSEQIPSGHEPRVVLETENERRVGLKVCDPTFPVGNRRRYTEGASRDASSPCPSIHDHMWSGAGPEAYCLRCRTVRTGEQ